MGWRLVVIWGVAYLGWGQEWAKREAVLVTLKGDGKITQAEFEYAYSKAHGGWEAARKHTPQEWRTYLDAYIRFRRKVAYAQALRLDTSRSFREEYESYIRQLARPYLLEKAVLDTLLRRLYERSKEEIRASHILISVKGGSDSAAYQRALALRDSIIRFGRSFEEMARLYSDDPSALGTGGDLGYFSVFDMVWPFEEAAYATPVGQVSLPVRSPYGYHLIYVRERVPNRGARKAAHILIRWGPTYAAKDSLEAKKRIEEVYRRLEAGESFEELAKTYSDDPMSAARGGELGWMRLLPEMEEVKRSLEAGAYSRPFRTRFGWHILKVLEVKPLRSYEEMRAELRAKLQRDERFRAAEKRYFGQRLRDRGFVEDKTVRQALYQALDSLYPDWEKALQVLPASFQKRVLATIAKQKYSVEAFLKWARQSPAVVLTRRLTPESFDETLQRFYQEKLLDLEIPELSKRYPEFRLLEREYYYGVLFFAISEREVWRKAVEDTAGLHSFYEANKSSYPAGERFEVVEIQGADSLSLAELPQRLASATLKELDSLNRFGRYNWRILPQYIERSKAPAVLASLYGKGNGEYPRWVGPVGSGREWRTYLILQHLPAGYKTFDEVKVELIQRYQEHLEAEWVAKLEKLYPAVVNEKVFSRLFR